MKTNKAYHEYFDRDWAQCAISSFCWNSRKSANAREHSPGPEKQGRKQATGTSSETFPIVCTSEAVMWIPEKKQNHTSPKYCNVKETSRGAKLTMVRQPFLNQHPSFPKPRQALYKRHLFFLCRYSNHKTSFDMKAVHKCKHTMYVPELVISWKHTPTVSAWASPLSILWLRQATKTFWSCTTFGRYCSARNSGSYSHDVEYVRSTQCMYISPYIHISSEWNSIWNWCHLLVTHGEWLCIPPVKTCATMGACASHQAHCWEQQSYLARWSGFCRPTRFASCLVPWQFSHTQPRTPHHALGGDREEVIVAALLCIYVVKCVGGIW